MIFRFIHEYLIEFASGHRVDELTLISIRLVRITAIGIMDKPSVHRDCDLFDGFHDARFFQGADSPVAQGQVDRASCGDRLFSHILPAFIHFYRVTTFG